MKIAYLGNFNELSGYSNAARETILALDEVGIDVVPRYIKMTSSQKFYNKRIDELSKKDLNNVDAVIQHNLPSEFAYKSGILNIGLYAWETNGFPNSNWSQHIKMMDMIIVPSKFVASVTQNKNTYVIPHPLNTEKFSQPTTECGFSSNKNTLKFYTIGEYNKRKNIQNLLIAYFSTFDSVDNVLLVLKLNGDIGKIKEMINDIKFGLKRFSNPDRYPKVVLIHNFLTEQQIDSVHEHCDVFVSTSYGEGFCLPAAEAMGWGNMLLVPNSTAFTDFGYPFEHNMFVNVHETKCFGSVDSLPYLYTSDETWWSTDIVDLSSKMRYIYDTRIDKENKEERKTFVKNNLSRHRVGNAIKELINDQLRIR